MNDNTSSLWNDEDWKREFTDIFFARRRIIFLTAILIFCVAVLIAFLMPPTYKATASVLVRGKKPQINPGLLEDAEIRTQDISEEDVVSELQILASPELIRRTLSNLYGVDAKAEDTEVGGKLPMIEAGELADAVSHVKANLETEVVPSSNVIRISYYEKDEALAEEILDGLLSEYVSYRTEVFSPTAEAAFLKDRAQHYLEQLHAIEGKILDLTRNGNVALIKQEMDNNSMLKKELSHRLAQAEMEYKQQWKKLEPLEKSLEGDGIQFFAFLGNESMNRLGEQLAILVQEREDAARNFLSSTPKIKALNQQIDKTYKMLHDEAAKILADRRGEVESLAAGIDQLQQRIKDIAGRNLELQEALVHKQRLERQIAMLEHSYETYARRSESAQISNAIAASKTSGDVSILTKAALTAELAFPKPLQTILAGIAAGIVAGLSLGFLAEYLDHTVSRPSEVSRHMGLPVICSIRKEG